jgi:hypothetical protein
VEVLEQAFRAQGLQQTEQSLARLPQSLKVASAIFKELSLSRQAPPGAITSAMGLLIRAQQTSSHDTQLTENIADLQQNSGEFDAAFGTIRL